MVKFGRTFVGAPKRKKPSTLTSTVLRSVYSSGCVSGLRQGMSRYRCSSSKANDSDTPEDFLVDFNT